MTLLTVTMKVARLWIIKMMLKLLTTLLLTLLLRLMLLTITREADPLP